MNKKIAFVFASPPIFGKFLPISFLSECQLIRALSSLENGVCELVYVALNHFSAVEKFRARKIIDSVKPRLCGRVHFSFSDEPFELAFAKFLISCPYSEMQLDVLCRTGMKDIIVQSLDDGLEAIKTDTEVIFKHKDDTCVVKRGYLIPTLLTPSY